MWTVLSTLIACAPSPAERLQEGLRLAAAGDPRAWDVCGVLEQAQGRGACRVAAARSLEGPVRGAACTEIVQEHWRDECWFELAEDRAAEGRWDDAIAACARGRGYRVDCARHVYQESVIRGGPEDIRARILARLPEARPALGHGLEDARRIAENIGQPIPPPVSSEP